MKHNTGNRPCIMPSSHYLCYTLLTMDMTSIPSIIPSYISTVTHPLDSTTQVCHSKEKGWDLTPTSRKVEYIIWTKCIIDE